MVVLRCQTARHAFDGRAIRLWRVSRGVMGVTLLRVFPAFDGVRARNWRLLTGGLAILWAILVWISLVLTSGLGERLNMVAHSNEVIAALSDIQASANDVETAQRGYVITGSTSFLGPFAGTPARLRGQLNGLRRLTQDNASQQLNVDRLKSLIVRRLELNANVLDVRSRLGLDAARRLIAQGEGKRAQDAIRSHLSAMRAIEERLLADRSNAAARRQALLNWSMAGALLLVGLGILLSSLLGRACQEAEGEARENATRYRELFDASPLPIILTHLDSGRIELANRAAISCYGYTLEELQNMRVDALYAPEERPRLEMVRAALRKGETHSELIWRQCHKNGDEIVMQITGQTVPGPHGMRRLLIATDVTTRERFVHELQESERRFQQVFDQQFQLMATLDAHGRIQMANDRFAREVGVDFKDLIGCRISDLTLNDPAGRRAAETLNQSIDQALSTEQPVSFQFSYRTRHSLERILECVIRPVVQNGDLSYLIFEAREVTAAVKAAQTIAANERRLLSAQERIGMCNWEYGFESGTLWWSDYSSRLLSIASDRLPKTLSELSKLAEADDEPRLAAFLEEMNGVIGAASIRFDGAASMGLGDRSFELVAEALQSDGSDGHRLVGSLVDITGSLLMERRLHQSQRLEAVGKLTGGIAMISITC